MLHDLGILWQSSVIFVIFDNVGKFSENVRKRSCGLSVALEESSEIFGKWLKI